MPTAAPPEERVGPRAQIPALRDRVQRGARPLARRHLAPAPPPARSPAPRPSRAPPTTNHAQSRPRPLCYPPISTLLKLRPQLGSAPLLVSPSLVILACSSSAHERPRPQRPRLTLTPAPLHHSLFVRFCSSSAHKQGSAPSLNLTFLLFFSEVFCLLLLFFILLLVGLCF